MPIIWGEKPINRPVIDRTDWKIKEKKQENLPFFYRKLHIHSLMTALYRGLVFLQIFLCR